MFAPPVLRHGSGPGATAEDVVRALCLAPRGLRRKLDQEGSSLRAILDELRQQLAEQLLRSTNMKIGELAFHLGDADTASLTRAFRRWFGMSPGQFRQTQAAPADHPSPD